MPAYYNEIDEKAAAWLRELIRQGHVASGDVDTRSIEDVAPDDLRGYRQCHWFAGIGVWSYALRRAGWPDDRPVWTGSCPCQPFSAAGKGAGFADERHLWPSWHWLIDQRRPPVVFGEQVASKDAEPWLDLVQADMEALGYALGAVPFPSAGVGAPHIRDRLYWVADATDQRHERSGAAWRRGSGPSDDGAVVGLADGDDEGLEGRRQPGRERAAERLAGAGVLVGGLGHTERLGAGRHAGAGAGPQGGHGRGDERHDAGSSGAVRGLGDPQSGGKPHEPQRLEPGDEGGASVQLELDDAAAGRARGRRGAEGNHESRGGSAVRDSGGVGGPGQVNGLWRDADWLFCRDGKWRPVEPGTFPLAHGAPARVGCVCAACLENSAEGANDEDLRALRQIVGPADGRLPAQVLQPAVPMGRAGEDARHTGSRSLASAAPVSEHALRDVRGNRREPPTSPGREPDQQHAGEYSNSLSLLPQQGPSCERCGATSNLYAVTVTGNRVARLRGYGNAINAEAATAWIESYLDTRTSEAGA